MTQAVMCQEDPGDVTLRINTGGGDLRNSGGIELSDFGCFIRRKWGSSDRS